MFSHLLPRFRHLVIAAAILLGGCGFQLRGHTSLPFSRLYVPASSPIGVELNRNIIAGTETKLVDSAEQAQAQLLSVQDQREKIILSLKSAGRVREFHLRHKFAFRVVDARGREFLPLNELTLTRDISFNDAQVLAKEAEELLLYRDMQTDMVQQILRRMGGARIPTSLEPETAPPAKPN